MSSFNLLQNYLSNRYQRTPPFLASGKIFYLEYQKTLSWILFCSIFFVCDMFLILNTVYFNGYASDNTHFAVVDNIGYVIRSLEEVGENLIT